MFGSRDAANTSHGLALLFQNNGQTATCAETAAPPGNAWSRKSRRPSGKAQPHAGMHASQCRDLGLRREGSASARPSRVLACCSARISPLEATSRKSTDLRTRNSRATLSRIPAGDGSPRPQSALINPRCRFIDAVGMLFQALICAPCGVRQCRDARVDAQSSFGSPRELPTI